MGLVLVFFRVNGDQLAQVWTSDEVMSNHYATSVYHEGHLYGFHGRQEYSPNLRAVELQTGQVKWDIPTYGGWHGHTSRRSITDRARER